MPDKTVSESMHALSRPLQGLPSAKVWAQHYGTEKKCILCRIAYATTGYCLHEYSYAGFSCILQMLVADEDRTSPGSALGLERPLSLQRHNEVRNGCLLHLCQALLILSRREVRLDLQPHSAYFLLCSPQPK